MYLFYYSQNKKYKKLNHVSNALCLLIYNIININKKITTVPKILLMNTDI